MVAFALQPKGYAAFLLFPHLKLIPLAIAEEGKTINGDNVYAIIQEAKQRGVTVASLIDKLPNATARIMVTPGPGVVEQAPRTRRKKDTDSPENLDSLSTS